MEKGWDLVWKRTSAAPQTGCPASILELWWQVVAVYSQQLQPLAFLYQPPQPSSTSTFHHSHLVFSFARIQNHFHVNGHSSELCSSVLSCPAMGTHRAPACLWHRWREMALLGTIRLQLLGDNWACGAHLCGDVPRYSPWPGDGSWGSGGTCGSQWPALTRPLPQLLHSSVPIFLWSGCWAKHAAGHHCLRCCHLETKKKGYVRERETQENILHIFSGKIRHQYCKVRGVTFHSSLKTHIY